MYGLISVGNTCTHTCNYSRLTNADERAEAGTNYRGSAVRLRKGARGPTVLHTFLPFTIVSLFVDCTS
jgi:hypothetical protein